MARNDVLEPSLRGAGGDEAIFAGTEIASLRCSETNSEKLTEFNAALQLFLEKHAQRASVVSSF
jgi:hypothetical protein